MHKEGKKERKEREGERKGKEKEKGKSPGSGANSAKERGEKEWKGGDPDTTPLPYGVEVAETEFLRHC
jgi:hypothetical protein